MHMFSEFNWNTFLFFWNGKFRKKWTEREIRVGKCQHDVSLKLIFCFVFRFEENLEEKNNYLENLSKF